MVSELSEWLVKVSQSKRTRFSFEMMSADMVQNNGHIYGTVTYFGFSLWGIICLIVLLVKGLTLLIRKIRKKEKTLRLTLSAVM